MHEFYFLFGHELLVACTGIRLIIFVLFVGYPEGKILPVEVVVGLPLVLGMDQDVRSVIGVAGQLLSEVAVDIDHDVGVPLLVALQFLVVDGSVWLCRVGEDVVDPPMP